MGSRAALTVLLPVPDVVLSQLPLLGTHQYSQQQSSRAPVSFKVTPVFFNIGVNERATLAESLGQTAPQHQSNLDNYSRLHAYFLRYRKLKQLSDNQTQSPRRSGEFTQYPVLRTVSFTDCLQQIHFIFVSVGLSQRALTMLFDKLHSAVHSRVSKNVEVLQLASRITVAMQGTYTECISKLCI